MGKLDWESFCPDCLWTLELHGVLTWVTCTTHGCSAILLEIIFAYGGDISSKHPQIINSDLSNTTDTPKKLETLLQVHKHWNNSVNFSLFFQICCFE